MPVRRNDPLAYLHSHYIPEPNSGCWLWLGPYNKAGYGTIGFQRQRALAHRLMLSLLSPCSDATLFACHRCDVPCCINPEHLFWATPAANAADMAAKRRAGKYPRAAGEVHGMSSITDDQARTILNATGRTVDIARQLGVSYQVVWDVRHGRSWRHL